MGLRRFMVNVIKRVGRLSLIKSRPEDADELAPYLRLNDKRECLIMGLEPLEALREPLAIDGAFTYTIRFDENPIAMCGTVPVTDDTARVWMLGTGGINNNFRPFLRGCKEVIRILQGNYDMVENFVPVDHTDTIMWLSWCGFTFDDDLFEVNGHMMMRFVRCINQKNNVYYLQQRPVMH
jgi:hypothetical protein